MRISVIMQVYLGDYPGSRSHPKDKFIRAIASFLSQTYPDKELVIVADRCILAKKIYDLLYANSHPNIKFVYLSASDAPGKRMYDNQTLPNGYTSKYYRGVPKEKGRAIATGDIITYQDSDDIILPNHLHVLATAWKSMPQDIKWIGNTHRLLNRKVLDFPNFKELRDIMDTRVVDLSFYGIHESYFINAICYVRVDWPCASYALSHRAGLDLVKWDDCEATFDKNVDVFAGNSEDVLFTAALCKSYGSGWWIQSPTYVVCHYSNIYDN